MKSPVFWPMEAEFLCEKQLQSIAPPTQYIAGYRTADGRELALERGRAAVYCWAEPTPLPAPAGAPLRMYAAEDSRNSNVNSKNCPRLRVGNAVHYWRFDSISDFRGFLEWYGGVPSLETTPALEANLQPVAQGLTEDVDVMASTPLPKASLPVLPERPAMMGYQITTVADILGRINQDLFIPAIQRPYVWTTEQIAKLFDSLMRGYPIGALMFWDLPAGSQQDWEIYQFISDFRFESIHNDRAELAAGQPVTLVLDGQQRLTSLLIGLKGSYTVKQKHKRKATDEAWNEKVLYLDLAHSPEPDEAQDDEESPVAEHYRFQFFDHDQRPSNRLGELWFEVGLILAASNTAERDQMIRNWVDSSLTLDDAAKAVASVNLHRLWESVWSDRAMAYFTEASASYDRVLDIFIRANDGGTKLSRSDLLMSVITLRWERFNAREETEALIDQLNTILQPRRVVTREFVLRSCLFLNDLNFSIKVQNFVPSNIRLLEQSWERVKTVLRFSADYLREHGFYGDGLPGSNVLMLVAYYVHRVNADSDTLLLSEQDKQRLRCWIILLSYHGLLGTQTNSTFMTYRSAVRRGLREQPGVFPWCEVAQSFARQGRPMDVSEDTVNRWCNTMLESSDAEALLSLLYPDNLAKLRRRMVPLVQSRYFMPEELRRAGVPDVLVPAVQGFGNRLILGVALRQDELDTYYALPFEQWAQQLSPEFLQSHCLPADIGLYRMDALPQLVATRRSMIRQRLVVLAEPVRHDRASPLETV